MNKYTCIFSFAMFMQTLAVAQDYAVIVPGRTLTFAQINTLDEDSAYFFARVINVVDEPDGTAYYLRNQTDTTTGWNCDTDTSFFGNKVLLLNDAEDPGKYLFFNNAGDTLVIHSNLWVGREWHFQDLDDGGYVRAKVSVNGEYTIAPGVTDSLYRIKLQVFDAEGNLVEGVFPSGESFDITKFHGVSELFDFNIWPEDQKKFYFRGNTNPSEGFSDVTARSSFALAPGYEMHYQESLTLLGSDSVIRLFKYFVLDTAQLADRLETTFQRTLWQDTRLAGTDADTLLIMDTIIREYIYDDLNYIDTMELLFSDLPLPFQGYALADFKRDTALYSGISHKYLFGGFGFNTTDPDTCYFLAWPPLPWPQMIYAEGIGQIYQADSGYYYVYETDPDAEHFWHVLQMVYFQKGLITWGEPIDFYELGFTGINEPAGLAFQIYPNPAEDHLQISGVQHAAYINIYSADGRLLRSEPYYSYISVSELPSGIYLLQIMSDEGTGTTTFIKQ